MREKGPFVCYALFSGAGERVGLRARAAFAQRIAPSARVSPLWRWARLALGIDIRGSRQSVLGALRHDSLVGRGGRRL